MPSSFVDSIPPIMKLLVDLAPQSVVDVGPGWGKYGLLCREYLPDLQVLEAVEVESGRMPYQDCLYDRVHIGDACGFIDDAFWRSFNLALMIDVIEHLTVPDAHQLLKRILVAGCSVLVSTPKQFYPQEDEANPYERHVSWWTWNSLRRYPIAHDVSTIDSLIYLLEGTH